MSERAWSRWRTADDGNLNSVVQGTIQSAGPESLGLHVPWGVPTRAEADDQCLLLNHDYVTSFDRSVRLPVWTAFTLQGRVSRR